MGGSGGEAGAAGASSGTGGGSGTAGAAGGPSGDPLPEATVTCAGLGASCERGDVATGIYASFRKDSFFPDSVYNEYTEPTGDGGRFHVASISAVSGSVTRVLIGGVDAESIYTPTPGETPAFEWYHVYPREVVAGEPVWVSFHSLDPAWDSLAQATISVETDAGEAVNGSFDVATTPVPLTYVTTVDDGASFVIHVKNMDTVEHTVTRVLVNGHDVVQTENICLPKQTLAAGEAALWTVPNCETAKPGDAWTVVVEYADAPAAVGVGRVVPELFPIESWNNTSECTFPSGKKENFDQVQEAGIDTMYMHGGVCNADKCDCDSQAVIAEVAATPGFHTILTSEFSETDIADTSGVAAFSTGDESDGEIYNDETGVPNPAGKAAKSRAAWARYPEVPTFNGGKTNGHIGVFAGMADIQGMDLYFAACAPHITQFGEHPPPRAPYDYLKNTRDNHMPQPTWLYSQGLAPTWNREQFGEKVHVQPDPQELLVQGLSVVAAGGKGLMWFQSNLEEANYAPERWAAITRINRMVRGVREVLREGDITGGATSSAADDELLVELIRSREALVVPVINIKAVETVDDVMCALANTEDKVPHWVFDSVAPDVVFSVPEDFGVADVFEVGATTSDFGSYHVAGREVTLRSVELNNELPVRLFVFAASSELRQRVEAAMVLPGE